MKKSKITQNSLPVPCSLFPVPLPQRQFLTPTYLLAIAKLSLGLETIEYEQLRSVIKEVLTDDIPQAHEVTRVLEQMTRIASSDEASTPVLDWDKEERKLHITDPFFAFYLKWGVTNT
ncbi:hypothetical protein [Dolichospermum sp. UHCC 0259]|uniref:hypothetical protein n=1 Tax=Dolichospermum sp. UHCC 0259 TaxID=2590010 RepID=UPI001580C697|nr:hypothetical protein [Dolichospermum sp. UHCC 0259]